MLRRPKRSKNEAVAPKEEEEEGAFCSMESDVRIA
jgi:hypothetical protein